jgi:hypothetical protein
MFCMTSDLVKIFYRPETLDFFNLFEVFLNRGCTFSTILYRLRRIPRSG